MSQIIKNINKLTLIKISKKIIIKSYYTVCGLTEIET